MTIWRCPKCGATYNDREPFRAATVLDASHTCPKDHRLTYFTKQEDKP